MLYIKSPWFYVPLIAFIFHQVFQLGFRAELPIIDDFLDPFLFLPIILGLYLQERRWVLMDNLYVLDKFSLYGLSLILCVLVEVVYPYLNDGYTFDIYDFPSYGAGAVYFQYTINRL